jgi:hypothetical protein
MSKPKLPNRPVVREELNTPAMHDASHERDMRCSPIAHEVIKFLATMDKMPVGSHVSDEEGNAYLPVIREVMTLMLRKGIKVADATYVFGLARQAIQAIENGIDETLNQNMNRVTETVYGLAHNDFNEVTIKQLNNVVMAKDKIKDLWTPILAEEDKKEI